MSILNNKLATLTADAKSAAALVSSLSDVSGTAREALIPLCQRVVDRLAAELNSVATSAPARSPAAAIKEHPTQRYINGALDMTDGIDLALGVTSDLLHLVFSECARLDDSASRVDSAMRAIERYLDDVSRLNRTLQADLRHLETLTEAMERSHD